MVGVTAHVPCTSQTSKNQISVKMKKLSIDEPSTTCFPKHPLNPFKCEVVVEESTLVIDSKYVHNFERRSKLTISLGLHVAEGHPTKLSFNNASVKSCQEIGLDITAIPCQLLKSKNWPVFGALADGVLAAFISARMPDSCNF